MKGLFLGAGASYEVGMPLVLEFSKTLRINLLKRLDSRLFDFKSDTSLKEKFITLLKDENLNYEQVVGELENLYISDRNTNPAIHGVLIQLIECIQILLLEEQMHTLPLLKEKVKDYYGIKNLIKEQGVLNVFSLNHDIVFEEICSFYKIPFKDGFDTNTNKFSHIANFKSLTSNQLESGSLNFFEAGENGVNLIKLHGSLDIFSAEDKKVFLKCSGDGLSVGSHYLEIRKIEDHSQIFCKKNGVRPINELFLSDSKGQLQFLRRSLLSGAHKFQGQYDQIAPAALLKSFQIHLNSIEELIVIGYGFGDIHINDILNLWLKNENHSITIYDPFRKSIPDCIADYKNQIIIVKGGITDFFLSCDSSNETVGIKIIRRLLSTARERLKRKRLAAT